MIDETHAPDARSWVDSAQGHDDFPIQNLPLGVFTPPGGGAPRGGVAIGDMVLDLSAAVEAGLMTGGALEAARTASGRDLNGMFALGAGPRRALRRGVFDLLRAGGEPAPALLHDSGACRLHLPARIGDYTDFYVGIHHANNVGRQFRPDNPLLPNYKYVPIGYHGRASSVRPSGVPVVRPRGQSKPPGSDEPRFGPSQRLDYELELGVWIGPGNALGEPIPIGGAADHVAGFCLLNDWSARDLQAWEYQPLGPFLAKNFQTTISPWVVTPEALAPFRIAQPERPAGDPAPLAYLHDDADQSYGALGVELTASLLTARMRQAGLPPHRLSLGPASNMYWTVAQIVAHHTSNGCDLNPGDLLGSGTISTPEPGGFGSLMEVSRGGAEPISLPNGETRAFLADGDEVILTARAQAEGRVPIGFGACRAVVLPARGSAP